MQLKDGWEPSTDRVLVRPHIDSQCIGLGDEPLLESMEPDRREDEDSEERVGGAGACVNYQREYPRIPVVDSRRGGGKGGSRFGVKPEADPATNAKKRPPETVTDKEEQ